MKIFQINKGQLVRFKEKKIDLERDIQKLTEQNLNVIFGLSFVRSELTIHNFRIDTLAFDDQTKSFVIVEYKRDKNFSVIDQGVTYLYLMLNNKSDFILEYNEKKGANLKREDVDWTQTRVIFVADSFNTYQVGALGFKDLPIELWQAKLFEEGIVVFSPMQGVTESKVSIKTVKREDATFEKVSKEVKVYDTNYYFNERWHESRRLYDKFKDLVFQQYPNSSERFTKYYIAFIDENTSKSFVEIVPQKKGIKLYFRLYKKQFKSIALKLGDCSKIGHWTNGNTYLNITKDEELPYVIELVKQAHRKA